MYFPQKTSLIEHQNEVLLEENDHLSNLVHKYEERIEKVQIENSKLRAQLDFRDDLKDAVRVLNTLSYSLNLFTILSLDNYNFHFQAFP